MFWLGLDQPIAKKRGTSVMRGTADFNVVGFRLPTKITEQGLAPPTAHGAFSTYDSIRFASAGHSLQSRRSRAQAFATPLPENSFQ